MTNRIEPSLPVGQYVTYGIVAPRATHFQPATCAEVECEHFLHGWKTLVSTNSTQADYIRSTSKRSYSEIREHGGVSEFRFPPGQTCFASSGHRLPIGRPEIFVRRQGDWRGNPTGDRPFIHKRAEDWVEDFALNQQALHDAQERG